jgi:hypothetical protein
MAIEGVTGGSNDVRTKLIGPVLLGCLPLKTSSDDDDVMVYGVFGMGMINNYPILEFMSLDGAQLRSQIQLKGFTNRVAPPTASTRNPNPTLISDSKYFHPALKF